MRPVVQVAALFAFLTAMSVVVAGVASTLALGRAQVGVLDADLAAVIRADYSADPDGKRLAPLDAEIGEAVRQDELRLEDRNYDLEIVDVFYPSENTADEGDPDPGTETEMPTPTPPPPPPPPPTPQPGPARTPTPTPVSTPTTIPPSSSCAVGSSRDGRSDCAVPPADESGDDRLKHDPS